MGGVGAPASNAGPGNAATPNPPRVLTFTLHGAMPNFVTTTP